MVEIKTEAISSPITPSYNPAEARKLCPEAFTRPAGERIKHVIVAAGFVIAAFYCLWQLGFFDFRNIWLGLGKLGGAVSFMFPPAHHGYFWEFLYAILETLGMAFLGTLTATLVSIPLGFLGARNVAPNWLFHFGIRRGFDCIRGVDALIWALIFVNVVGLGPFAGILAIAAADTGTLSKLFAEAIESVDRKQIEGVKASGANKVQVMRFGILPQVFPVILSQALYFFESNTRSATILGVVGAGGIGLQLSDRIRVCDWDEAMFIIIMILIAVSLIDTLSKEIRLRIIDG